MSSTSITGGSSPMPCLHAARGSRRRPDRSGSGRRESTDTRRAGCSRRAAPRQFASNLVSKMSVAVGHADEREPHAGPRDPRPGDVALVVRDVDAGRRRAERAVVRRRNRLRPVVCAPSGRRRPSPRRPRPPRWRRGHRSCACVAAPRANFPRLPTIRPRGTIAMTWRCAWVAWPTSIRPRCRCRSGTEVTTRVDRVVEGEIRPQGATGRVAKLDGDRVEVAFLDGKRATYLRAEVMPRKLGVARYAQRRAAAWDALASVHRDRHARRLARVGRRRRGLRRGSPRRVRAAARRGRPAWSIRRSISSVARRLADLLGDRQGDPPGAARRSEHARDAVRVAQPSSIRSASRSSRCAPAFCRRRSTAASAATRCRSSIGSSTTSASPSTARP